MSTIRIGEDGVQWPARWVDGVDGVVDEVVYRLRSPLRSVPGDQTAGLPYLLWAESRPTPGEVTAAIRAQAESVAGVARADVEVSQTTEQIRASVTLRIALDGVEAVRSVSTRVYPGIPVAWYVLDPR